MDTSFVRQAVVALVMLALAPACVEQNDVKPTSTPSIHFAVESDAVLSGMKIGPVRTIASSMNVGATHFVGFDDGRAVVTFAQSEHKAKAVTLDDSLATVSESPRSFPKTDSQAYLATARATVPLEGGRSFTAWTEESTGRVLAQIDQLLPVVVYGGDVVGCPHAASADGKRVIVTFTATTEHGFDLMATSVDAR
jgi:hypothetical protein